ncbi:MAG: hypothetical protein R2856_12970 [Caldilineaceae bacterium]
MKTDDLCCADELREIKFVLIDAANNHIDGQFTEITQYVPWAGALKVDDPQSLSVGEHVIAVKIAVGDGLAGACTPQSVFVLLDP